MLGLAEGKNLSWKFFDVDVISEDKIYQDIRTEEPHTLLRLRFSNGGQLKNLSSPNMKKQ